MGCLLDYFQVMIFSDNGTDVPRPGERRFDMKDNKELLRELIETLNEDQAAYLKRLAVNLFGNNQSSDPKL